MANDSMKQQITCEKCGRSYEATRNFFKKRTGERYPVCKNCLTLQIDNANPDTFKWILKEFDFPYIEDTWNDIAETEYKKKPASFGPKSVIGMYMRTMNMGQYAKYHWSDTPKFEEKKRQEEQKRVAKIAQAEQFAASRAKELEEKLAAGEISQAEFDFKNPLNNEKKNEQPMFKTAALGINEDDILEKMSEEERYQMMLKWGNAYRPSQWVQMETLYRKYENEYELSVDREETLKQICKLNIKMSEALDVGDSNAYKALSTSYDQLRRSSKFTEAQNKEDSSRYLDSIGELVRYCEREGGIIEQLPPPDEYPQDKIDFTIRDLKNYNRNLIINEMNLGDLIETYIKKLEQAEEEKEKELSSGLYTSIEEELADQITEEDAEEFYANQQRVVEEEAELLAERYGGDDLSNVT